MGKSETVKLECTSIFCQRAFSKLLNVYIQHMLFKFFLIGAIENFECY